ncbi:MAG: VIT domain-containing protein, partial [Thermoguttaceae bacterium]
MAIPSRFVWGWLLAVLLAGRGMGGEDAARWIVGHGPGILAVRDATRQAWEIADEGTLLPEECELRTGGAGACRVSSGETIVTADSDARITLSAGKRLIGLEAGRVFVHTEADEAWTVTVGAHRAVLSGDTEAELSFGRNRAGAIAVVRGWATVAAGEGPATKLTAGHSAAWSRDEDAPMRTRELSEGDKIEAGWWTSPGATPQGLGQLLVSDSQAGTRERLNVARYHVNVVLQPPVALVQIDQTFYNPFHGQREGTFVFNLPRGASVSRFAMYVSPNQLVDGEVIDRNRAGEIYQAIVSRKRDPAILEQIGDNLFRMRVFPIFGRDTKRILLDYTIPLTTQHEEYSFRLPLFSDLEPIWDFRLTGSILGPTREGSLRSPSHPDLAFVRQGEGRFGFEMKERLFKPDSDFVLSFGQEDRAEVRLRSFLAPPLPTPTWATEGEQSDPWSGRAATYFMATIRPEESAEPAAAGPADVLLLADTSSGMRGVAAVSATVGTIVHSLGPEDRVRLMAVDVGARSIHDGWVVGGSAEAEGILAAFRKEFCLGGTDLATSFREGLAGFADGSEARRRVMIYVGDGEDERLQSTGARVSVGDLARELAEANVVFVGITVRQTVSGPATLDQMARETGGLTFDLTGGRSGQRGLFGWLLAGLPSPERIELLEVDGAAAEDVFFPPAWIPGEPLEIVGRAGWTDRLRLKLATWRGGKRQVRQWELKVADDADDVFVGRLWAQRKLAELCGSASAARAAPLHERIVALSQEWSVLTPQTAFLVLESEEDYRRWQVDRRVRRRYWKPAEALPNEPLPEAWLARVTPDDTKRRQEADRKRFERAMAFARDAMEHENYALAHGLLQDAARLEAAKGSEGFAQLLNRATAEVNRESVLKALGAQRGLFEPRGRGAMVPVEPQLAPLLTRSLGMGDEFLRRHPHAPDLLLEVPVRSRRGVNDGFNLEELAGLLEAATSTNVVIDERALEDVGCSPDVELDVYGNGRMSLGNYVRFVLEQVDLVMIEEADRILITTPEEAELRLKTEVYPVADLYLEDHAIQLESLSNAYLDCDQAAQRRIESKLDRPISVDLEKMPLDEAMEHLARELDDTVLIDHRSLEDVSLGPDQPVTAHWKNVPARQALTWLLDQLDLDYYVSGEALIVTTPDEKEHHLDTRLHSGREIVFEYEAAEGQGEEPAWYRYDRYDRYSRFSGGGMGMGGFGGMGGMAMGAGGLGGMGGMMGG